MISVVLRDAVDSPYPDAARDTLEIPEDRDIHEFIGCLVPFVITIDYSDLPESL